MNNDERIKLAVQKAEDAFWESIASSYPEATSGDLEGSILSKVKDSMTKAVRAWVEFNVPE